MPENTLNLSERRVFSETYERTHMAVYRFIYALHGGPRQEVEDLTAETYMRAWRARGRFEGDLGAAQSWLFKIARNLVIDLSRRQRTRRSDRILDEPVEALRLPTDEEHPESVLAKQEQFRELWRLMGALSDENREILVLRYILGWQVKEIAAHLELEQNTVSQRIHRSIERIQKDWPEQDE
jgi:RNA polymerase sigma-70 factor (ECF subfamily)